MSQHDSNDAAAEPDLFAEVERALAALQGHPDATVRDMAATLLAGVDAVHRAGLTHLVQALHAIGGDTLINRLIADPAIRMLLMSYDLIAVDRRLQTEEAIDTVRGHLHDHGVDVELVEVVGGVVYARLHMTAREGRERPTVERVRADLEAALREHLIGFQELEFRERESATPPAMVPLETLRRANRPVYRDVLAADEVPEGTMKAVLVDDLPILIACVAGDVYAIRNQCGDSPLPLEHGTLEGREVLCPWHGCRYDVRSGHRLDAPGRVPVLPVAVEDGRIRVAVDVAAARA